MITGVTKELEELSELEHRFKNNPGDIDTLRDLSTRYFSRGMFSGRVQPIYEKAHMAVPGDRRFAQGLNVSSFLKHLRRFTIDSSDPDLVDQEGLRSAIGLVKEYIKELSNSPDLFFALGDLHLLKGNILLAIGAYENAIK